MTRDELHRWLFANMEGRLITFDQKGMPFRIMKPDAEFGGVVHINDTKCRLRILHRKDSEKGKRYDVYFPDREWKRIGTDEEGKPVWTDKVSTDESTLVGYMEISGNWKDGKGRCIFHTLDN